MGDSLTLLDMFLRGVAVSAMAIAGFSFATSSLSRHARLASGLASLSIVCWIVTESDRLWQALGYFPLLIVPAYAVGGLFWLFVLTVFDDRPPTLWSWAPAGVLLVTGFLCQNLPQPGEGWLWASRNGFAAALSLHAAWVVARGWSGDLLAARRRLRGLVLGFAAVYGAGTSIVGLIHRVSPHESWLLWTAGQPYGAAVFAAVILAGAMLFVQARPAVIGAPRRAPGADVRTEAAERLLLQDLNALMAGGLWREEGLTITEVARRLEAPEHRLRRLINQRLGHRNFADFVNGHRIEAARRRLADPAAARTTVAAIAFDLGFGSLGPFNRAFRAATGVTPTEWRREALAQGSPELKEAS